MTPENKTTIDQAPNIRASAMDWYYKSIQSAKDAIRYVHNAGSPFIMRATELLDNTLLSPIVERKSEARFEPIQMLKAFFEPLHVRYQKADQTQQDPSYELAVQLVYDQEPQHIQNNNSMVRSTVIHTTIAGAAGIFRSVCESLSRTDRTFNNPVQVAHQIKQTLQKNNALPVHQETFAQIAEKVTEQHYVVCLKEAARTIFNYKTRLTGESMNDTSMLALSSWQRDLVIKEILDMIENESVKEQAKNILTRMKSEAEEKEKTRYITRPLQQAA